MLRVPAVQRNTLLRSHRSHALLPAAHHHSRILAIRVRAVFSAVGASRAHVPPSRGLLRRAEDADSVDESASFDPSNVLISPDEVDARWKAFYPRISGITGKPPSRPMILLH